MTATINSQEKNRSRLQQRFDRLATDFDNNDFLHAEVRGRLLDRLPLFRLDPERILDLGCGTGGSRAVLSRHFPEVATYYLDLSEKMAASAGRGGICADATRLPFPDNSFDLIISNFMLHYVADLPAAIREANRVLRYGGLFLFSIAGSETLHEIRDAWSFDKHPHVDGLPDLKTVGDVVTSAKLTDPVLDSEVITVTYSSFDKMVNEISLVSAARDIGQRRQGLTGKNLWSTMRANCEANRDADDRLPVSIEVIYGHAFGGKLQDANKTAPETVEVPLSQLLGRGPRKMTND